jgi:hypothetical protein
MLESYIPAAEAKVLTIAIIWGSHGADINTRNVHGRTALQEGVRVYIRARGLDASGF